MLQDEKGAVLIEFVFAMIIFCAFMYGLIAVSLWGIGSSFVQEAAHDAAQKYAVVLDGQETNNYIQSRLGQWAYVFVKPNSIRVNVWHNDKTAYAEVSAVPRISRLYVYDLPQILRTSQCTLEYRFRHPQEFSW